MEKFSLEKYLENPNRKITTRYGDREVRIICTDRKGKCPIVALMVDMDDGSEYITSHSINGWIDDEEKYSDKRDLFFADEKEELTEFDYAVLSIISDHNSHTDSIEAFAKRSSKKLLAMARNEIVKDAVELTITNTSFIPLPKLNIKAGDKVKIIIVKEK